MSTAFFHKPYVKRLLAWSRFVYNKQDGKLYENAVTSLVIKANRTNQLEELERAISTQNAGTKCITFPRPVVEQMYASYGNNFPHVIYCQLWRWPDLQSHHELLSFETCEQAFHKRKSEVCVNPYHFHRVEMPQQPPVIPPTQLPGPASIPATEEHTYNAPVEANLQASFVPQTSNLGPQRRIFVPQTCNLGPQRSTFVPQTTFVAQSIDLARQTGDLGRQSSFFVPQSIDLARQTSDLGRQSSFFVPQSYDLARQTSDLGRQSSFFVPQSIDLARQTSDLGRQTSELGRQTSDLGRQTNDLARQTSDLGHQSSFFVPQSIDLGHQTSDVGRQTSDVGRQTSDVGRQTSDLGRQTSDLGHQTSDLARQTSDLGHQTSDLARQTSDLGRQSSFFVPRSRKSVPKNRSSVPKSRSSVPKSKSSVPKRRSYVPKSKSSVPKSSNSVSGPTQSTGASTSQQMNNSMGTSQAPMAPGPSNLNIETILYPEPPFWCSITYYELDQQIGETFHASQHPMIVDGFANPFSGDRFCLGLLTNVKRNAEVYKTRLYIEKGVRLDYINGDAFLECLSKTDVFVHSTLCCQRYGWLPSTVVRVPFDCNMKVFVKEDFVAILSNRATQGYEEVCKLIQMCTIRMSFVSGWGPDHNGEPITKAPCWIEIRLNAPLQLVDQVLQQISPPRRLKD